MTSQFNIQIHYCILDHKRWIHNRTSIFLMNPLLCITQHCNSDAVAIENQGAVEEGWEGGSGKGRDGYCW